MQGRASLGHHSSPVTVVPDLFMDSVVTVSTRDPQHGNSCSFKATDDDKGYACTSLNSVESASFDYDSLDGHYKKSFNGADHTSAYNSIPTTATNRQNRIQTKSTGNSDINNDHTLKPATLTSGSSFQALAEPSKNFTASAEPSIFRACADEGSIFTHVYKAPDWPTSSNQQLFSVEAIQKQRDIITSIWPATTVVARRQFPEFCRLYERIKSFGLPNFLGARVPIQSGLNIQAWRERLTSYHDREICVFLEYGWPVGYHAVTPPTSTSRNHPSALAHPDHIAKFIDVELSHGAMVGPFSSPPFAPWTRLSPIMTRPKKDCHDRRVIIDLSYPHGEAVNDGINTVNFYGKDISYTLPTIGDLVALIQRHGRGAFLWKADLARAYRQLRIDPLDTPLLGISFKNATYLDLCPSFGCRTSSAACQRVSNALAYILAKEGHQILAYLDDYASCDSSYSNATAGFSKFIEIASSLGLDLATHKCVAPTTSIEWLGYAVDSNKMTVSIPRAKMEEFVKECGSWVYKRKASKKNIQSLVGRMNFIANCVTQGRRFMSRVLASLRAMGEREWTTLSDGFRLDVKWFVTYAKVGNGVSLVEAVRPQVEIECDSSLSGGGGVSTSHCYTWRYSEAHTKKFKNIHELEAINLIVAFKTLAPISAPTGAKIIISTDNSSSAYALESGRTKDPTLAACARELWLLAATRSQVIVIVHKPGTLIPLSDALSRYHEDPIKRAYVNERVRRENLKFASPAINDYIFFNPVL